MTSPRVKCYNNPAFCDQYDTKFDYEIDPDSPKIDNRSSTSRLVSLYKHPQSHPTGYYDSPSEEFEESDNSNNSIVVEECNNRRITLICEKRKESNENQTARFQQSSGAYYQDISLDSEEAYEHSIQIPESDIKQIQPKCKLKRRMDSPIECFEDQLPNYQRLNPRHQDCSNPQKLHRYEELDGIFSIQNDEGRQNVGFQRVHRYAEISVDNNGFPNIENEMKIVPPRGEPIIRCKPNIRCREGSVTPNRSFSPTSNLTYQRAISPHPPRHEYRNHETYTLEMADFSPPKRNLDYKAEKINHNINKLSSPNHRQSPIGASSSAIESEHSHVKDKMNKNLLKLANSFSNNSKSKLKKNSSNVKPRIDYKECNERTHLRETARRNISHSFIESTPTKRVKTGRIESPNPYRSTTQEINRKTSTITPMSNRKKYRESDVETNFTRVSNMFQSAGRIFENPLNDLNDDVIFTKQKKGQMKRNKSVPNFMNVERTPKKSPQGNLYANENTSPKKLFHYQNSPTKSERWPSLESSIDQIKRSWSNFGSESYPPTTMCITISAFVQLVTGAAACIIAFYLMSKLGRRYYLDFGILASFINLILGILGFRARFWKWLPNRNYVSGYLVLGTFSLLTCASLATIIIVRPMAGDPLLDVASGAICGVSVLTIILAMVGLTMSGGCKHPPPDNRVAHF